MAGPSVLDHLERVLLFPLPGGVLFPGERLPLHIFEPRYRRMTEDAWQGGLPIAMGHIRPDASPLQAGDAERPPVFSMVGAGFIDSLQELPEGRFLIELVGERRLWIVDEEESPLPYRVVRTKPAFDVEVAPEAGRQALDALGRLLLAIHQSEPKAAAALSLAMAGRQTPSEVSDAIAAVLHVEPLVRQSWLTELDPVLRLLALTEALEIYLIQTRGKGGTVN
jgi:uncharacterized protein